MRSRCDAGAVAFVCAALTAGALLMVVYTAVDWRLLASLTKTTAVHLARRLGGVGCGADDEYRGGCGVAAEDEVSARALLII